MVVQGALNTLHKTKYVDKTVLQPQNHKRSHQQQLSLNRGRGRGVFLKNGQSTAPWADRHPLSLNTERRNRQFHLHSAGEDERTNSELSLQGKVGEFHLGMTGLVG